MSGRPFDICSVAISLSFFKRPLANADAGIAAALVGQQEFRVGPALVFLADQVLHGDFHVVEENIVDLVLAVEHDDRPDRDAGRFHVDQQERNTLLLTASLLVRTRQKIQSAYWPRVFQVFWPLTI